MFWECSWQNEVLGCNSAKQGFCFDGVRYDWIRQHGNIIHDSSAMPYTESVCSQESFDPCDLKRKMVLWCPMSIHVLDATQLPSLGMNNGGLLVMVDFLRHGVFQLELTWFSSFLSNARSRSVNAVNVHLISCFGNKSSSAWSYLAMLCGASDDLTWLSYMNKRKEWEINNMYQLIGDNV